MEDRNKSNGIAPWMHFPRPRAAGGDWERYPNCVSPSSGARRLIYATTEGYAVEAHRVRARRTPQWPHALSLLRLLPSRNSAVVSADAATPQERQRGLETI